MKTSVFFAVILSLLWAVSVTKAESEMYGALIDTGEESVNVRRSASVDAPVVGKIFTNQDLAASDAGNHWCRVWAFSKDDKMITGFLPRSTIKRVDSREVIVDGKPIKYRLILDIEKLNRQHLPEAKPTSDRAYAINPYSGEKMYFGFLRSQAIITDPETGREYSYTRMSISETRAMDSKRAADQEQRRVATRRAYSDAEKIFGGILDLGSTPDKYAGTGYHTCRACGGTGYLAPNVMCNRCHGAKKIKDGSGRDDF